MWRGGGAEFVQRGFDTEGTRGARRGTGEYGVERGSTWEYGNKGEQFGEVRGQYGDKVGIAGERDRRNAKPPTA